MRSPDRMMARTTPFVIHVASGVVLKDALAGAALTSAPRNRTAMRADRHLRPMMSPPPNGMLRRTVYEQMSVNGTPSLVRPIVRSLTPHTGRGLALTNVLVRYNCRHAIAPSPVTAPLRTCLTVRGLG